jgi:hypothetical protein
MNSKTSSRTRLNSGETEATNSVSSTPIRRQDLSFEEEVVFYELATRLSRRYSLVRGLIAGPSTVLGLALAGWMFFLQLRDGYGSISLLPLGGVVALCAGAGFFSATRIASRGVQRRLPEQLRTLCLKHNLPPGSSSRIEQVLGDVAARLKAGQELSDADLTNELAE